MFEKRAVLYLAAAVSDFYVPQDDMPTHKIQSGLGAPKISMQLVPKMLAPLVGSWVPEAFVVSFKLETDESLLIAKSRESLNKYKHKVSIKNFPKAEISFTNLCFFFFFLQLVIANILQTRKHRVIIVTPNTSQEILLTKEQVHSGLEIEEPLVAEVVSGWIFCYSYFYSSIFVFFPFHQLS